MRPRNSFAIGEQLSSKVITCGGCAMINMDTLPLDHIGDEKFRCSV